MKASDRSLRLGYCLLAAVLVSNCADPLEPVGERVDPENASCFDCHGDEANGHSAPPPATWRDSSDEDPHLSHLGESDWRAAIECTACHIVPETNMQAGHIDSDLPAEVVFADMATANETSPTIEDTTCSDVYCHGSTLADPGDAVVEPEWELVAGGEGIECGAACHSAPPVGAHPDRDDCEACHGEVIGADREFLAPELHINGTLEVEATCDSCHGGNEQFAPPTDTEGNSDTALLSVGAHQEHLGESDWHAEIECAQCHVVPEENLDVGHLDSELPAELTFGDMATNDDADPEYDFEEGTCADTYCHGSTLEEEGAHSTPVWNVVDGTQSTCDSCHGNPPEFDEHPNRDDCNSCHGAVIDSDDSFVDPTLHINGLVEVELRCDSCHGSDGESAPPTDTDGMTSTELLSVGAHRSHLGESDWHAEIECTQCHIVPEERTDEGHTDTDLPAELTFGDLATAEDSEPAYDFEEGTCSDAYCHGNTMENPGTHSTPVWNVVDETQTSCESCHGNPPPAPHANIAACNACHGLTMEGPDTFKAPELHINGIIERN